MDGAVEPAYGALKGFCVNGGTYAVQILNQLALIDWQYFVPLLFFAIFFLQVYGTMPNATFGEVIMQWGLCDTPTALINLQ